MVEVACIDGASVLPLILRLILKSNLEVGLTVAPVSSVV